MKYAADPIEELEKRIAELEKENSELKSKLEILPSEEASDYILKQLVEHALFISIRCPEDVVKCYTVAKVVLDYSLDYFKQFLTSMYGYHPAKDYWLFHTLDWIYTFTFKWEIENQSATIEIFYKNKLKLKVTQDVQK